MIDYLESKLGFDPTFTRDELGDVVTRQLRDPRSKLVDEVFVTFETREIRDAIKVRAPNLANYREAAGMRLHIPNHLQKDFKSLMRLAYDLKQHPNLKRSVKFNGDDLSLFMDIQLRGGDDPWTRVRPEQARVAIKSRLSKAGPSEMSDSELGDLLTAGDE